MRYQLIAAVLLLTGCGRGFETAKDPRTIHGVDPVFVPFVDKYLSYKGHGLAHDIPIQFTNLPGNIVGLCTRWSTGWRQIEIDQSYWNYWADDGERLELIAHELGHCDLDRNHVLTEDTNGMPVSIMYPYVFGIYPYILGSYSIDNYMNELFHPGSDMSPSVETTLGCVKDIDESIH